MLKVIVQVDHSSLRSSERGLKLLFFLMAAKCAWSLRSSERGLK